MLIPYSFDYALSYDSDFLIVNSKVTSDYDSLDVRIFEWVHLSEVLVSKGLVASSWPPLARISQLSFDCLSGELCRIRVWVLFSEILI